MNNPNNILRLITNESFTEISRDDNTNYNCTFYHNVKSNNEDIEIKKPITCEEIPENCMMVIFSFWNIDFIHVKEVETNEIINRIINTIPNNYHHLVNEKYLSLPYNISKTIDCYDIIFLNDNIKNKYSTHFITCYNFPNSLQEEIYHIITTKKLPCIVFDAQFKDLTRLNEYHKRNNTFKIIYKDYCMEIFIIDNKDNFMTKKAIK